jgi:hypothetical protein
LECISGLNNSKKYFSYIMIIIRRKRSNSYKTTVGHFFFTLQCESRSHSDILILFSDFWYKPVYYYVKVFPSFFIYVTVTYLKLPPNPLLCCRVWANISYFLMSLSLTDLRANFMASSKWALVISGTGS